MSSTIIDANAIDCVFDILGSSATFSNLSIRDGNVNDSRGGIALDGTDPAVTDIRISPKGIFAESGGGGDPNFEVRFKGIVL